MIFTLFIWIGIRQKRNLWKHIFFNIGAVYLAFGFYEFFLTIRFLPNTIITRNSEYFQPDSLLGYSAVGPEPYKVTVLKRFTDSGDTIYHAQYGFENGYRKTLRTDSSDTHAYFLGGSFVFGEGVNDHETLPSFFAQLTEGVKVRNYGFHGYGPHQVLMQLRHRVFLKDSTTGKRGYVYYVFIPPHISRAHGRTDWDKTGPYFSLEQNSLIWKGSFYDKRVNTSQWKKIIQSIVFKSRIYNLHFRAIFERSDSELQLILSLISEMKAVVDDQDLEFRLILEYQSPGKSIIENMKPALDTLGIAYFDTHDAINNKTLKNTSLYIKGDHHPTAKFNKLLATFLNKQLKSQEHFKK